MNKVFNKTQKQVTLYSIPITLKETNSKMNYDCNFLNRVLRDCTLLYSEDNRLELSDSCLQHPEVYIHITNYWNKRLDRALYFEEKSVVCDYHPSNMGHYLRLQQSIQQVCLGLIYLFWEYQPSHSYCTSVSSFQRLQNHLSY